ncbi:N2227-like protein-domain-containing protein [Rhodotorula diobovata]|uniref:N2227-like protein-domain-containing protein n=1 Tax=Rhodotorula diobovata TaxID=5288 RepID=A0A5C5FLU5_9BASI|nr:N2227-like protein-domain-containing protein [Rhodotorula diobovata]
MDSLRGPAKTVVPGQLPARPPPQTPSLLPFVLTSLLFSLTAYCVLSPRPARLFRRLQTRLVRLAARWLARLPVPDALQAPSDLGAAIHSFSAYSHAQAGVLTRKWAAFDRMPRRHRAIGDSLGWKDTLRTAEDAVEANAVVADELAALGLELARREGVPVGLRSRLASREDGRVVETLKHFVRDWSAEGRSERDALFPPVLDALRDEFGEGQHCRGKKVLVPGCGLGRLAYEIAHQGFSVDANDFSHFMNLGVSLLFTRTHTPLQHSLAPYVHSFSHQRTRADLVRRVSFPDVVPRRDLALRFVPGDFVELVRAEDKRGQARYDAVVTLFFLDTASNLLAYLDAIWAALKPGGVWINEGPLLYYGNPGMELPLEDVVRAAQLVGFVVEQRNELREVRYTADDRGMYTFAYDCAFWVARKPGLDAAEGGETSESRPGGES